uniref:Putative secreted protein n=1 Tax=Anopheles darlingi TaxID=43151 RepID=A0A2M4DM99_ANODA
MPWWPLSFCFFFIMGLFQHQRNSIQLMLLSTNPFFSFTIHSRSTWTIHFSQLYSSLYLIHCGEVQDNNKAVHTNGNANNNGCCRN